MICNYRQFSARLNSVSTKESCLFLNGTWWISFHKSNKSTICKSKNWFCRKTIYRRPALNLLSSKILNSSQAIVKLCATYIINLSFFTINLNSGRNCQLYYIMFSICMKRLMQVTWFFFCIFARYLLKFITKISFPN